MNFPLLPLGVTGLCFAFASSLVAEPVEYLSLHSSVRRALKLNPELISERITVDINKAQVIREVSEFGWGLEALARYEDRSKPQNTREFTAVGGVQLPGNTARIFVDENFTARFGLKKKYSTGTTLEFGSRFSRLSNTLNRTSANSLFTPEYETFTGITLTQPLLKGFGKKANLAALKIAKERVAASEVLTRVKAMNLVAEVASRYTDVIAAEKALEVHQSNISLAESMIQRNRELLESGEGVETDVTTAELALYQRQDGYITATSDKIERLNALFALIDRGPDLDGTTRFEPSTAFYSPAALNDKRELISYGQTRRLDIVYYNHVVETAKLNVLRAKDASKATLNLTGTAGVYGLDESADSVFSEAANKQGTEWSIGLNFKMALDGSGADAGVTAAKGQLRQAQLELSKARRIISLEVDTAYSRVDAAEQRIKTAKKAVELAQERLDQEDQLNQEGWGDFYRVVEQQQILGDARINLVSSEAQRSKAIIAVWLASGQIFDQLGISPKEVEALISLNKGDK